MRADNKSTPSEKLNGAQAVAHIIAKANKAKDLRRLVAKRSKGNSKIDRWYGSASEFVMIKARRRNRISNEAELSPKVGDGLIF